MSIDKIREALLDTGTNRPHKLVDIGGATVKVVAPTFGELKSLEAAAEEGSEGDVEMIAWCTRDPDTGEHVFDVKRLPDGSIKIAPNAREEIDSAPSTFTSWRAKVTNAIAEVRVGDINAPTARDPRTDKIIAEAEALHAGLEARDDLPEDAVDEINAVLMDIKSYAEGVASVEDEKNE